MVVARPMTRVAESGAIMSRPESQAWRRHVTDLVIAGQVSADGIDTLVGAGLAGYAVDRLRSSGGGPEDLLNDQRLHHGRMAAAARHATVRRAAAALIRAWREVGIESLLFKGFYLAEFVYPDSSWRKYSDVDVALRSATGMGQRAMAATAAEVAERNGWRVLWRLGEPESVAGHHHSDYDGHELLQLFHTDSGISLDAHRRLVHSNVNRRHRRGKGEAVTQRVWSASKPATLDGVPVAVPAPLDAALVGLIAARSWSGDRHRLRPHDLLDLDSLMAAGQFGREQLMARASELGLAATTRLFLRRCDPTARTLDLRKPSALEANIYDALILADRSPRGLEQLYYAALLLPGKLLVTLQEYPHVVRRLRRWRAGHSQDPVATVDVVNGKRLDRRTWMDVQYAVRRSLQLNGVRSEDERELALACLQAALRRRGHVLESRSEHARIWFEYEGEVLSLDWLGNKDVAGQRNGLPGWPMTSRRNHAPGLLTRLARLGWNGVRLRLEALHQLRRVVRRLKSTPFKMLQQELMAPPGKVVPRRSAAGSSCDPAAIGRATESAARFVPEAMCVARSLAAQVMLKRRAVPSTLHFGFKRSPEGNVEGHAWLEAQGSVVTGDVGLDDFTRTATFDA